MPWKGVKVAFTVAVSYALGAWGFTFCLFLLVPADRGWWTMLLEAPVAVPLLTFRQLNLFMFVWLACVLLTSFVIYRLIRRRFAPSQVRPPGFPLDEPPAN
jgi:hypothetical protein